MIRRVLAVAATVAAASVTAIGTPAAASASAAHHPGRDSLRSVRYEADNGTTWTLSNRPLTSTGKSAGYADAGVVVGLGITGKDYNGVTVHGFGPLATNLWFGDGSQAYL